MFNLNVSIRKSDFINSEYLEKFKSGINPKEINHIPSLSYYNHNYYEYCNELLYAVSDDDNHTVWYLICTDKRIEIGESFITDSDEININ